MRLLLRLKSTKDTKFEIKYNNKIQGFIYNLLIGTNYEVLHDKKSFKYFCFSNIFPIGDIRQGETRNLIISSPDRVFIRTIRDRMEEIVTNKKNIKFGEMEFIVDDIIKFKVKLNQENTRLISATPIIIRIPERKYEVFKIPREERKSGYIFWRPKYSVESFIKQLEDNLVKKYNVFYKKNLKTENIFEQSIFKKMVYNKIIVKGIERIYAGSIWEFNLSFLNFKIKKLLEFNIECGFGERNSFGFGFINQVNSIG